MTTPVKAIFEHGVFRPVTPVSLKEATEVEVLVPAEAADSNGNASNWEAAERFIGFIKTTPSGESIAEGHDKYLYK